MRRIVIGIVLGLLAGPAYAQPEVDALRIYLGTSGSTCTLHSGSGAPATSLGVVCDVYVRTDSPYTVYSKTGASTWTQMLAVTGAATGAALVSTGVDGQPEYDRSLYVDTLASYYTVPSVTWQETDASANNGIWDAVVDNETLYFRTVNDAYSAAGLWLQVDRTGTTVDTVKFDASRLQDAAYVSQTTAWAIDDSGAGDFRYLFTDELHARTFIADLEQALAGLQIITKSVAILQSDFTCPAAAGTATLSVEDLPGAADMQVFDANDWVSVRSFSRASQTLTIGDCVGQVSAPNTTPSGYQEWTFTRGSGGSAGSMTASTVVDRGAVVLDYGVSGAGYYEVNAVDGIDAVNSPYSQTVTWATAPVAANRTVQTRIGNLAGTHGYTAGTPIFGAVFGPASAANITIDPTNGIRVRNGTTNKIALSASGNASFSEGALTIDSNGIALTPGTAFSSDRAYRYDVSNGSILFQARDNLGGTARRADLSTTWSGSGNYTVETTLGAFNLPSSGGTSSSATVAMLASGSTAQVNIATTGAGGSTVVSIDAASTTISGRAYFTTNTTSLAGGFAKTATNGLMIQGVTGSSYDLVLGNNAGSAALAIITGGTEIAIAGVASDGTGKVVCVKSDSTLGSCTNQPNASGVCTCG